MPKSPSRIEVQWDSLGRLLADGLEEMIWEQHEEVEVNQDAIPLDVDWPLLLQREREGSYRCLSARAAGRLAGYCSFFIGRHSRHRGHSFAVCDVVYLARGFRGGMAGVKLLRTAETLLRASGVAQIEYGIKRHVRLGRRGGTVGDLLEHLGYKHSEDVFTKVM